MTIFIPVGRLTAEPEVRSTSAGEITTFGYAVDTGVKDSEGNKITNFFNVSVWGKMGENAAKHLHKGDPVSVTGSFCSRVYQATDGTKRNSLDIRAMSVDYLPRGQKNDTQSNEAQAKPPRRQQKPQQSYASVSDDDEMPF